MNQSQSPTSIPTVSIGCLNIWIDSGSIACSWLQPLNSVINVVKWEFSWIHMSSATGFTYMRIYNWSWWFEIMFAIHVMFWCQNIGLEHRLLGLRRWVNRLFGSVHQSIMCECIETHYDCKKKLSSEALQKPFKNIANIQIEGCRSVEKLINSALANFLDLFPNLRQLAMDNCDADATALLNLSFPHLKHLNYCFWHTHYTADRLKMLIIFYKPILNCKVWQFDRV